VYDNEHNMTKTINWLTTLIGQYFMQIQILWSVECKLRIENREKEHNIFILNHSSSRPTSNSPCEPTKYFTKT